MTQFKVGDFIEPVEDGYATWHGMEIIEYEPETMVAVVRTLSGRTIREFNLNPAKGVEFRCVNQS